ncbi:MAG: hypothetical protein KDF65_03705 [Anaerolineae bacterium]|nr:hypothetical protein [Anaerolineae bacterium]
MIQFKKQFLGVLLIFVAIGTVWLIGVGAVQAKPATQPPTVRIIDDYFNLANWQTDLISQVGLVTHREEKVFSPIDARRMWHTLPPISGNQLAALRVAHLYQGQTYDPAAQGAVASVDYVELHSLRDPSYQEASVEGHFIVFQNDTYYLSQSFKIEGPALGSARMTNLKSADFTRYGEGASLNPDFSAQGAPLTFGFLRSNIRDKNTPWPSNQYLTYEHQIRYWSVTINRQVEPPPNNVPPVAVSDEFVIDKDDHDDRDLYILPNDYDLNNDPIQITEVFTAGTRGNVQLATPDSPYVYYYPRFNAEPDSFSYAISDGEFTSIARVQIYIDCFCVFNCFNNYRPLAPATDSVDLGLIYRLRDQVMKPTVYGNRYVEMYYTTTPEIARILMLTQPDLGQEAVRVVEVWQDNLYSLVDGDGSTVVTQAQVEAIKTFLANLRVAGSNDLQQVIDTELTRLGPLNDYVGLTVVEAKTKAIGTVTAPAGNTVYLPLILK